MTTSAPTTATVAPQLVAANHFQLSGHCLQITYAPFVEAGLPSFTYQDTRQTLTFRGAEIESVSTEAGTVVSVRLHVMPDVGSTTFSVLVPRVQVAVNGHTPVTTQGITAIHSTPFVANPPPGQRDHYTFTALHGTASHVMF